MAQVAMCNFPTIKDAADVAIATMMSGIQVRIYAKFAINLLNLAFRSFCSCMYLTRS